MTSCSCSSCSPAPGGDPVPCAARPDLQGLKLRADGNAFVVSFKPEWARAFPQSAHLLREEIVAWQKTPWTLALA
jgi:exopolyphosphatase/guanosine-5'-triphosphate,3'-diphosphate pyrophosphatase